MPVRLSIRAPGASIAPLTAPILASNPRLFAERFTGSEHQMLDGASGYGALLDVPLLDGYQAQAKLPIGSFDGAIVRATRCV
jgi:hypothetical protein